MKIPRIWIRLALLPMFALLALMPSPAKATHIVGAELTYTCLSTTTNAYRIRLRLLRDCLLGQAPFDDLIYLYAFSTLNPSTFRIFTIPRPANTPEIIPTQWDACVGRPYDLCVEEAFYETTITIPPILGGWDFAWARCCRNSNIDNLFQPLNQGVTFLAHMPGPEHATCNSMPVFNNQLPTFICAGEDFYFDHSATDPDGDSLVYQLTRPYTGLNLFGQGAGNPAVGGPPPQIDAQNPMGAPPYAFVTYNGGAFTAQNPFGPGSGGINPQSGWLHFSPPAQGVYVVAISVFEYRNGILLSENKKDLQIHAIQCLPQNDPPTISHTFRPQDIVVGDTVIINAIDTTCYTVEVFDPDSGQIAVQPISAIFFGADAPSITVSGSNPLHVEICWESDCDYAGGLVQIILMGYDESNCPIYNPAFDTVFVRILPPPEARPAVGHLLPPSNPHGPDTLLVQVDDPECFTVWVADTLGLGGTESYQLSVEEVGGGGLGFQVNTQVLFSNADSTAIEVCFTAGCDHRDKLYRVILVGQLDNACPPSNVRNDTTYIMVDGVPNPPPVVSPDLSQVPVLNGDTIEVEVHDTICFQFSINDTFPGLGLSHSVAMQPVGGSGSGGFPPDIAVTNLTDSLLVDVCWYPVCNNVDGLYRFILIGTQTNRCAQTASNRDTVYVRVREVINPPPVIAHDFLPGYNFSGDTLLLSPDSLGCFEFSLRDSGHNTFLEIDIEVLLLGTQNPSGHSLDIDLTTNTDTLIEGTACFTPGCDFLDQTLLIHMTGRDTFDCNPSNWVEDSLYVRVVTPFNRPPVIRHILDGLPVQGGEVVVTPQADPFCYRVELDDPDSLYADLTAEGASYVFDTWFRYGNPGEVSISGTNPLLVQVCWSPSCYDSGERFELVICGRDTSRCGTTPEVCDTVVFRVEDCNIQVQNVFSPNADGINDDFVPYYSAGVEYYRLHIFDRWGKEVYGGENIVWNGKYRGDGADVPVGVYYYIFEYKFFSARGVPLKERSVGWVTLVR